MGNCKFFPSDFDSRHALNIGLFHKTATPIIGWRKTPGAIFVNSAYVEIIIHVRSLMQQHLSICPRQYGNNRELVFKAGIKGRVRYVCHVLAAFQESDVTISHAEIEPA